MQCRGMYSNYQDWDNQTGKYVPDEVAAVAKNYNFQHSQWPKIRVILKENRYNPEWVMQVLIMLAVQEVIAHHARLLLSTPEPVSAKSSG